MSVRGLVGDAAVFGGTVEQAVLHPGGRPDLAQRLECAVSAVAHRRQRRRDPGQRRRPGRACLAPRHVLSDHVAAGDCDEHDCAAVQVDAVIAAARAGRGKDRLCGRS